MYFELILVQGDKHGSSFSFFAGRYQHPVFPATFFEEAVLSLLYVFDTFVKIRWA
jgi:hypothetical protein